MSKTSIVFTGDIGFSRYMDHKWEDENFVDEELLAFLHSGDHVLANVEGALYKAQDDGTHGIFFHTMNPEATTFLDKIKADIWNIANNHIMDGHLEGLVNTIKLAHDRGYQTIGAGVNEKEASNVIYLQEAGGIGIFAVAYMNECIPATATSAGVFRWDNLELIKKRIKEIKAKCRYCVIVAHGGDEFADIPNTYTRERYLKYLELGADVIVAHHPHVVENYELFENGKMIFYSLGNFVFDTDYQRAHKYTDKGVLLKLNFSNDEITFEAIGSDIDRQQGHLHKGDLPAIFTNITAKEYELLAPLAAATFIEEEKKKMVFLEKEKYEKATKQKWEQYFFSEEPDGYDKKAHMDLAIVYPLSLKVTENKWQESALKEVIKYLKARND